MVLDETARNKTKKMNASILIKSEKNESELKFKINSKAVKSK